MSVEAVTTAIGVGEEPEIPGSAVLTALRRARSLSQSDLSARSGIAVRTVRNLERGGSSRPRLATLQRVLDVLEPDAATRATIVRELGLEVPGRPFEPRRLFRASLAIDAVVREVEPVIRRYRTLSHERRIMIRDRRIVDELCRTVVVATEPRVTRIAGVIDAASAAAATRLRVRAVAGCRLVSCEPVAGESLVFVQLDIPPLAVNDAHEYTIGYVDPLEPRGGTRSRYLGLHKSPPVAVLQVEFERADPPLSCRVATRLTPSDPDRVGETVELDAAGVATRTLTEPDPGWHGLEWSWR
jgi:transcriptional regulator with XRE-family HTH domain